MRRSRHHTQKTDDHGRIRDAISISERPATAEDRAVPGHWEGDLLCGSSGSQIATLVERQTRYLMLVKLTSKDSETVVNALIKHASKAKLNAVARGLNERPRKTLNYETLAERFQRTIVSTG